MPLRLTAPIRSHLLAAVAGLARTGFTIQRAPEGARLVRNGLLLQLRSPGSVERFRLFVYKVTGSGRHQTHERRIEITSTYEKGLAKRRNYRDVVLGIGPGGVFVGVDPNRIAHGGKTGNASSFFDADGLADASNKEIAVRPRDSNLFGLEYHAFFKPARLAEYLMNMRAIHSGTYIGDGPFSGAVSRPGRLSLVVDQSQAGGDEVVLRATSSRTRKVPIPPAALRAIERVRAEDVVGRQLSRAAFEKLLRLQRETGYKGEEYVLNYERKRLRRLHRPRLAERVKWLSSTNPCCAYDILSYDPDGSELWIEVKSTTGSSRTFPMSDKEWRTCARVGRKYAIYRVFTVSTHPRITILRDPASLLAQGKIRKVASGWAVSIS